MQTPAEKHLIKKIVEILKNTKLNETKILNIGAGKSLILEKNIQNELGDKFVCDRMDIADCHIEHPNVGKCFVTSVELMPEIKSNEYDVAFANYVFEHVADLKSAATEIARVLKKSGYLIISLPNPSSPEFILSKHTPLKLHQIIKGSGINRHAYKTHYAYSDIKDFIKIFENNFSVIEIKYWANTLGYFYRFPIIKIISKIYDKIVNYLGVEMLMGNVCIVFKK